MELTEKLTDFITAYAKYTDRKALEERIRKHIEYKTYFVIYDTDGNIIGCCLWNITSDGSTVQVLDCVIKREFRNNGMLRNFLSTGLESWPVKFIEYCREYDDRKRPPRSWDVNKFLRRL